MNLDAKKEHRYGWDIGHVSQDVHPVIAQEVTKLINHFISQSWPTKWKSSNVIPVYSGADMCKIWIELCTLGLQEPYFVKLMKVWYGVITYFAHKVNLKEGIKTSTIFTWS